jgi:uncharacterized membrane protein (UPF0127 family)
MIRLAPLVFLLASAARAACAPDIVEIADTPETRAQGLMFRDDLPRDAGMLFLWPEAAPRVFWMENTPLPLDMLFIDPQGRVCGLVENAEPFTRDPRPSGCDAKAVLEIHGGLADALGVRIGARLRHPAFGDAAAWPCD